MADEANTEEQPEPTMVSFPWRHPVSDLINSATAMGMSTDEFIAMTMEISVTAMPDWQEIVDDHTSYDSSLVDEMHEILDRRDGERQAEGGNR